MRQLSESGGVHCEIPRNMHQCTDNAGELPEFGEIAKWRQGGSTVFFFLNLFCEYSGVPQIRNRHPCCWLTINK